MTLARANRLVAIVGRPNVGKSTLFNRITKSRKSLVHDEPGVTRDRILSRAEFDGTPFFLCDTGGFEPTAKDNIKTQLVEQAELAIEEADAVLLVVDTREGLHPIDTELVRRLRRSGKTFYVVANKCDRAQDDATAEDFRQMGVEHIFPVSAEHNRGVGDMLDVVIGDLKKLPSPPPVAADAIRLAIIGRPNVGKSSILNRMAGEDRSIVDNRPGTTRDIVDVTVNAFGKSFVVLDTAGIRRKSRMADRLEKYSALRAISCLEECDVAMLVIDAKEGPTEGDCRVAGYAFELRKPILIVVNKWDLIEDKNNKTVDKYVENLRMEMRYIPYSPVMFVSALENQRVSRILPKVIELHEQATRRVKTNLVNNTLKEILSQHTVPLSKGRHHRIKFLYATQVGVSPPRFVIFCSDPKDLHFSYKRFLENAFRNAFGYSEVPISLIFRERSRRPGGPVNKSTPDLAADTMPKPRKGAEWVISDAADDELDYSEEIDSSDTLSFDDE